MMTVDLALLVAMGVLFAGGIYLVLERNLTRILLGIMLINNAAVLLLFLSAGGVGLAPLRVAGTDPRAYADTLPQALILTAIVIGFAITAFMAAMIYRAWLLSREDEVEADAEDLKVARQSAWDAEDDSELIEEPSEFIDDHTDPNHRGDPARGSVPPVGATTPSRPVRVPHPPRGPRADRPDGGEDA